MIFTCLGIELMLRRIRSVICFPGIRYTKHKASISFLIPASDDFGHIPIEIASSFRCVVIRSMGIMLRLICPCHSGFGPVLLNLVDGDGSDDISQRKMVKGQRGIHHHITGSQRRKVQELDESTHGTMFCVSAHIQAVFRIVLRIPFIHTQVFNVGTSRICSDHRI